MALTILENNNIFYVKGRINASTTKSFIIHFDYILDYKKKITMDINAVKEIDVDGLRALKVLYQIAIKSNKSFSIIGNRCKGLPNFFNDDSQVAFLPFKK